LLPLNVTYLYWATYAGAVTICLMGNARVLSSIALLLTVGRHLLLAPWWPLMDATSVIDEQAKVTP
jgi:hypothetical protein